MVLLRKKPFCLPQSKIIASQLQFQRNRVISLSIHLRYFINHISCISRNQTAHASPNGKKKKKITILEKPKRPPAVQVDWDVKYSICLSSFVSRHKRKVQNFLPCKTNHQGRCDMGGSTGITYDDVLINHHPTRLPNHLNPDTNTLTPIEVSTFWIGSPCWIVADW